MTKPILRKASAESSKGTLVLHIKPGDALLIDGDIAILVDAVVSRNKVKLVITAPKTTKVRRRAFERRDKIQDKDSSET